MKVSRASSVDKVEIGVNVGICVGELVADGVTITAVEVFNDGDGGIVLTGNEVTVFCDPQPVKIMDATTNIK